MIAHNEAINGLSPADYLIIEKEHKLLEMYLSNLLEACSCSNLENRQDFQTCDQEQQASCLGRLPSFLFHIIELSGRHFDSEETIMRSRPHVTESYEYFHAHRLAHANIMEKLQVLTDDCLLQRNKGNAAEIYHRFYSEISSLFTEHDILFDDPFIKSTKI